MRSAYMPDPRGPCPVCRVSWGRPSGESLADRVVEVSRVRVDGHTEVEIPLGLLAVRCPFCKTEWRSE